MKKWYESKTILINLLGALVTIAALIPNFAKDLGIDNVKSTVIVAFIINIFTIFLRTITNEKISR